MNKTLRIGIFTAVGVFLIVAFSVYVNDKPYWYRGCNEVNIHVDDATGLRRKSPVKTLGLDIGYINKVSLDGERVLITVCVTGPVKLSSETRAYVRTSGFLGDKFLELKPMERADGGQSGDLESGDNSAPVQASPIEEPNLLPTVESEVPEINSIQPVVTEPLSFIPWERTWFGLFLPMKAEAAENPTLNASREAELQDTVKKVGRLIDQLTLMVGDLREVTQQKEFKETIVNLNGAMKHLEQLLRPSGKTVKNLDSAMESLKNTMASAESVMNKIKEGEGSIGKLVNDPSIFDELKSAVKSVNLLLGKAGALKTYVDIGGWSVPAYDGNKARFSVMIAPNPGRYYLVGIASDPRGRDRKTVTTTSINGGTPVTEVKNVNEEKGMRITAMFGKYFGPLDLRVGILEDSGAVGAGIWFDESRRFGIHADVYSPGKNQPLMVRAYARAQIWSSVYFTGGVDSHRKFFNPDTRKESVPYFYGVGLFFDDEDLRYLLAFR